ncbi:MAG: MurR/RpiR family transcriptional regulator [Eubacteriales bacterium]|nr:MurR/RpiR family transcriptional regulator [Eubacteriales bacterium]
MRLEGLVSKYYDKLNPNDIIIWQYVFSHKEYCIHMSIEQVAEACSVSRSTVMRFAQKIGLSGFSELKAHLRWETGEISCETDNLVNIVCDTNARTIQYFREQNCDEICRFLNSAKRIFCYGTGQAQKSVAGEFQRMMLSLNILVHEISGEGELRKIAYMMQEKEDVVIIISKSGESNLLRDVMFLLNSRKVPVISLTRYGNNSLARMSTCNLFVDIEDISLLSNTNYSSMTQMFLVLEILFTKFVEYRKHAESLL